MSLPVFFRFFLLVLALVFLSEKSQAQDELRPPKDLRERIVHYRCEGQRSLHAAFFEDRIAIDYGGGIINLENPQATDSGLVYKGRRDGRDHFLILSGARQAYLRVKDGRDLKNCYLEK